MRRRKWEKSEAVKEESGGQLDDDLTDPATFGQCSQ